MSDISISERLDLVSLQIQSIKERVEHKPPQNINYGFKWREDGKASVISDCRSVRNELLRIIKELEGNR